jgi:hypothetical protein
VIRVRFVREPPSAAVDRDVARLAAVDEVRVGDHAAVALRHERHRRPCGGLRVLGGECRADPARRPDTVAGVARRRERRVILAGGDVTVVLHAHCLVAREAAAREHHAAARSDLDFNTVAPDDRARHAAVGPHQLHERRIEP